MLCFWWYLLYQDSPQEALRSGDDRVVGILCRAVVMPLQHHKFYCIEVFSQLVRAPHVRMAAVGTDGSATPDTPPERFLEDISVVGTRK